MFIRVLLPAPFSPSSAWTSPRRRSKSTSSLASTPGKCLTIPRASTARAGAAPAGAPLPAPEPAAATGGSGTNVMDAVPKRGDPRACARGSPASRSAQRRQRGGDPVVPPVHADRALRARGTGRKLVEVGLLELLPGGQELLAGVVLDRTGEDVEPADLSGEHVGQGRLDLVDIGLRQVGHALLRGLAVHEAVQAHRLRVGVEVLVPGGVLLVLHLLADPDVLRTPDPVGGGEARVLAGAGRRVVVRDRPLALLLGHVRDSRRVGAGEDDVGARVEERGGPVALLLRVVPGVDEPDVDRALRAGHLDAAGDRVSEAELLRDREGRHVADLRDAVLFRPRAGELAGEVLEVLDRAEEVGEVLAIRLVAGQVEERRVREVLRDRLHRVHVPERRADDEVEPLPGEAPEDLLGVGALRDQLDVRDVRAGEVLAQVLEALVVGLAPAAVVVWPDEDHRHVELAGFDLGDLEVGTGGGPGPGTCRGR